MKVFSSSKCKRNKYTLNQSQKANLQELASVINHTSSSPSLLLSSSNHSSYTDQQAISLSKQLVASIQDPYQCMLIYPLVLDCHLKYPTDRIFLNTTFSQQLHAILSIYLHKCSSFTYLQSQSRKLIDVFCFFIGQRYPNLLDQWINRGQKVSLGQWFYMQCISNFFSNFFMDKQSFTLFLIRFMSHGIAYVFITAKEFLKPQQTTLPQIDQIQLNLIKYCYIHKYKLQFNQFN